MLIVHRADRAHVLIAALGNILDASPDDAFASELIAVPARGAERWVTQSLSGRLGPTNRGDGRVANVAFPTPRDVTQGAIATACGIDSAVDPWTRERVVWPLLQVADTHLDEQWLRILAQH